LEKPILLWHVCLTIGKTFSAVMEKRVFANTPTKSKLIKLVSVS